MGASNTRTALGALLVSSTLILMIALFSRDPVSDALQRRPSTFFTDSTGTRAIYLVLDEVLPAVEQWRRPLTDLDSPSGSAGPTLIVMGPSRPLSPGEAVALDTWVISGGQLIIASSAGWAIQRDPDEEEGEGYLTRHGFERIEAVEGAAAIAVSVRRDRGDGRIVYVPDSYAFSNASLAGADNAIWLAELSAEWGGEVLFDEYHQGFGRARGLMVLIGAFLATPWGLVCLQLGLAGAVYILGTKRRFGRPVEELPLERTNPTERVEALASLLETARARVLAARTIQQYLNVHLSGLLGYRVDVSDPEIRQRLANRAQLDRSEIDELALGLDELSAGARSSDESLLRVAEKATLITRSLTHGADRKPRRAPAG